MTRRPVRDGLLVLFAAAIACAVYPAALLVQGWLT